MLAVGITENGELVGEAAREAGEFSLPLPWLPPRVDQPTYPRGNPHTHPG